MKTPFERGLESGARWSREQHGKCEQLVREEQAVVKLIRCYKDKIKQERIEYLEGYLASVRCFLRGLI